MKQLISILVLLAFEVCSADAPVETTTRVKYKKGKDVNFEELLIQGHLQRPEISVVTGDAADGTDGLLRLRENFLDRVAVDAGEQIQ